MTPLPKETAERLIQEFSDVVDAIASFSARDGEQHPGFRSKQTSEAKRKAKLMFRAAVKGEL